MRSRLWSDDDHDQLMDLIADGMKFAAAGAKLGRTKNACIGRFDRYRKQLEKERYGC
jgi:hypothetical protein